jgi:hypothetical protein
MRSGIALLLVALTACNSHQDLGHNADALGHSTDAPSSPVAACQAVGTSYCTRMYACYSPSEIAGFQLPPNESDCEVQMNAHCSDATPSPGYCKGSPQVSASAATLCASYFDGLSCTKLMQGDPTSICKTGLCAP